MTGGINKTEKIDQEVQNYLIQNSRTYPIAFNQFQRIKRNLLICNYLVGPEDIFELLISLAFSWVQVRHPSRNDPDGSATAARSN